MADSAAVRARRYRLHTSGDHSMCSEDRCDEVRRQAEQLAAADAEATSISALAASGRTLVAEHEVAGLSPIHRRLVLEAARIVDRLDRLDLLIGTGEDVWARLELPRTGDGDIRVVLNGPMAEARQQALALKAIAAELRAVTPRADEVPARQESPLERIRRERAERESGAS